jgi:hypothetical protein
MLSYIILIVVMLGLGIWSLVNLHRCFFSMRDENKKIYRETLKKCRMKN